LIFASATAVRAGLYDQVSVAGTVAALPVFAWEMSLAEYLLGRAFRTESPLVPARFERPVPVPA
jgi:hypothetical protein